VGTAPAVRRRILVALGAALLWLPVADNLPAAQPADWSRPNSIQAGGITVHYPRAWTAVVDETTIVVRSGATRIMLVDYGTTQAGQFPPRPDRFELADDDRRFLSCVGFEGWNVIFTDRGRAVQALVKLGPNTPKSDAAELLDRVQVG
jgi:hypothetical protein